MNYEICKDIESNLNMEFKTNPDFTLLSDMILGSTGRSVSASTLKRMWGYNHESVEPRRSTLDILARFLGYKNYSAYLKSDKECQSHTVVSKHLRDKDLEKGQRIRLMWNPDRACVVEYRGDGRFEVVDPSSSKLSMGDRFSCHIFIENEPIYMYGLCHDNNAPVIYVAGRKDGIRFELLP